VSSDGIHQESDGANADEKVLHPFTKLAIMYMGLGLGLLLLFLGAGIMTIPAVLGVQVSFYFGYILVGGLAFIMILTIHYLRKGKKIGAYLFFVSLVIYHLQYLPYMQYLLFSFIPSGVVSALFLTSVKHLL
jgi:hypothetical protein